MTFGRDAIFLQPRRACRVAIKPDGSEAWVTGTNSGTVSVVRIEYPTPAGSLGSLGSLFGS